MGIIVSTTESQQNSNSLHFHVSYLFLLLGRKQLFVRQFKGTNREKYFINYNNKVRGPTLAGNKQQFQQFFPSLDALFQTFDRKWTDLIRLRWTSKCFFPRGHIVYSLKRYLS